MELFADLANHGHEQVVLCRNDDAGLRAIIAIHSTALGPSLGGVRVYEYTDDRAALMDVLRLSRGMTYKAAIAGLDLGGGKTVVLGGPGVKSEALFRALGRFVQSLGGRYIAAEDMNTNEQDMDYMRAETEFVTGTTVHMGGAGEPGPTTAWGVFHGIRGCLNHHFGMPEVRGRRIAIQGLGNVGYRLGRFLVDEGAHLIVTDIDASRAARVADELGAEVVDGASFFDVECDVIAPCAIGAVLNEQTIAALRAPIVAGAANNILAREREDGERLAERGIVYAPDYVINAGGLIAMYCELKRFGQAKAMEDTGRIYDTVQRVLRLAEERRCTSIEASNVLAKQRIEDVTRLRRFRL